MAMDRGTTTKTAANFMRKSQMSRPATDGNKNVVSRARRMSAFSQVPMSLTEPLKGPDHGNG